MIADGAAGLRLRVEAAFTRTDVGGSATLANLELDVSRVRLEMAGSRVRDLPASRGRRPPPSRPGDRLGRGGPGPGGALFHDHAAGDAGAGSPGRVGHVVVGSLVDHDCRAVIVKESRIQHQAGV